MSQLDYGTAGSSRYGRYYRHSGRLNVLDLLVAMAIALAVGLPLAVTYAAALQFVPILIVHGLGSVTVGFVIGLVFGTVVFRRKVRNVAVVLAAAGAVSVACYYVHWVTWEAILMRADRSAPSAIALVVRPDLVGRIAVRSYENGTWRLKNGPADEPSPARIGPFANPPVTYGGRTGYEPVSGWPLGLIWLAEAVALIGVPIGLAKAMVGGTPFCEPFNRWCTGPTLMRRSAWAEPATVRRQLESGQFAAVAALPQPADLGKCIEFSQYRCSRCGHTNTLSALVRTVAVDRKGVRREHHRTFVRHLLLTPGDVQQIASAPEPTDPHRYTISVSVPRFS